MVISGLGIVIRIIVEEIELTILLQKTIFVYLIMVLIHICTELQDIYDYLPRYTQHSSVEPCFKCGYYFLHSHRNNSFGIFN